MTARKRIGSTWAVSTVGELASSVEYGYTAKAKIGAQGPRYLRITDIQDGSVDWRAVPTCTVSDEDIQKYRLSPGDLVFARTGATTGKSFLIRDCPDESVFASYLIRLRLKAGVLPGFMAYYFQTAAYWRQISEQATGTAQPGVNATRLREVQVSIAPTREQEEIVKALDSYFSRLDDAVASLERVQRNLKRYRASVLKAAVEGRLVPTEAELARQEGRDYESADVLLARIRQERKARWIAEEAEKERAKAEAKAIKDGKPWTKADDQAALANARVAATKKYREPAPPDTSELPGLPEGWCWVTIHQIADVIAGYGFPKHLQGRAAGSVPFYKVGDISRAWQASEQYLTQADHYVTADDCTALRATPLLAGTTIFAKIGAAIALNRRAMLSQLSLVDNNVFGVAPVSGVDSEYLFYLVCTLAFGEDSRATTVPSLRKDDVGLRPVPLAPAAEQRSIARALGEKFSTQYHLRSVADASRRRCVRLRQSILKWAFEGRLVDQDPNDEPASALLERIKAEREKAQATAKARKKPARKTRKKRSA